MIGRETLRRLRETLQEVIRDDDVAQQLEELADGADAPESELGVLTGYVVIAQWRGADGGEWLTKTAGDINDEPPAIWTVKGLLYHALDTAQRDADSA